MSPETASSWWHRATPEQRLAQIDGGIDCRMTAGQVAMACGLENDGAKVIHNFANRNGRHFLRGTGNNGSSAKRHHRARADRAAYLRGEHVDFWGNDEPAEGVFA